MQMFAELIPNKIFTFPECLVYFGKTPTIRARVFQPKQVHSQIRLRKVGGSEETTGSMAPVLRHQSLPVAAKIVR